MFIAQAAKKVHCSASHLNDLIKAKKINAEKRATKNGRQSWYITDKIDIVKANVGLKAGYHKTVKPSRKESAAKGLLFEVSRWMSIDSRKRSILIKLSSHSLAELRILEELTK